MIEVAENYHLKWIREDSIESGRANGWQVQLHKLVGARLRIYFSNSDFRKPMTRSGAWREMGFRRTAVAYIANINSEFSEIQMTPVDPNDPPTIGDVVIYEKMWPGYIRLMRSDYGDLKERRVKL